MTTNLLKLTDYLKVEHCSEDNMCSASVNFHQYDERPVFSSRQWTYQRWICRVPATLLSSAVCCLIERES